MQVLIEFIDENDPNIANFNEKDFFKNLKIEDYKLLDTKYKDIILNKPKLTKEDDFFSYKEKLDKYWVYLKKMKY